MLEHDFEFILLVADFGWQTATWVYREAWCDFVFGGGVRFVALDTHPI